MTNKTIYINYYDGINDKSVRALMNICTELMGQHNPDTLYFLFASPGGWVNAGVTFHNFLRSLPLKIVMHNVGVIDSIATVIFLAADERYAAPHSSFLFHGVEMNFSNPGNVSASKLNEHISQIRQDERKIADIYMERTHLQQSEIYDLFLQGESKDPQFALSRGIIQHIIQPVIPKGEIICNININ